MATISAYYVLTRTRAYDLPIMESIQSILPLCETIAVLYDQRFGDVPSDAIMSLGDNVMAVPYELDLESPTCWADAKNEGRAQSMSTWLLEMEPTDILDARYHANLLELLERFEDSNINLIGFGNLPFFNGAHLKLSAPLHKVKATRRSRNIVHGIPNRDRKPLPSGGYCSQTGNNGGCGYISKATGRELSANYLAYPDIEEEVIDLSSGVWVCDMYWYSVPTAWDRKVENTYYEMLLKGEVMGLDDYYVLPDGEEVDFWEEPQRKDARLSSLAVREEMEKDSDHIRGIDMKFPPYMNDWLGRQRVIKPMIVPPELTVKHQRLRDKLRGKFLFA